MDAEVVAVPDVHVMGPLDELALVANQEHALASQAAEGMVEHAIRAGAALQEAKAHVKHGEWLPWLEANFAASERTAQTYMSVSANPQHAADLGEPSIRKALKAIGTGSQDVHYSSDSDEWETPQDLFDELNAEFKFDLDVCALPESAKCKRFFSPADDGLAQKWAGVCWMNPPYGQVIGEWMRKAAEAASDGATVVCLVPARVDTAWWWDYCLFGEIRFLRGRLKFGGAETSAPFPSAVVVFGPGFSPRVKWWER